MISLLLSFRGVGHHTCVSGLSRLALSALRSLDPDANSNDEVIWISTVETVLAHRAERGFDRRNLVSQLSHVLIGVDGDDSTAEKWIEVAEDVLSAKRDIPHLDDSGSIGQRAALALLIAHEADTISRLSAGDHVKTLVNMVSSGFLGFKRMEVSRAKSSMDLVAATLWIGEILASDVESSFVVTARTLDQHLRDKDTVSVNGIKLMDRIFETPPYMLMLRARAEEAGFNLIFDRGEGILCVELPDEIGKRIFVEEETPRDASWPVVRFWIPLFPLKARSPNATQLKRLLKIAWKAGCAVGSRSYNGTEFVCAFARQPTNTLDRDEFAFHINRIRSLNPDEILSVKK